MHGQHDPPSLEALKKPFTNQIRVCLQSRIEVASSQEGFPLGDNTVDDTPQLVPYLCALLLPLRRIRRLSHPLIDSDQVDVQLSCVFFPSLYGRLKLDTKLSLDFEILLALCARKGCGRLCSAEGRGSNKYVRHRARRIHASKETYNVT